MIVTSISHFDRVAAYKNWRFISEKVPFNRVYYVEGGEAYYSEGEEKRPLKKGYLYVLPADREYNLFQNDEKPLLHTYCHIMTSEKITQLREIEVVEGSALFSAIKLFQQSVDTGDLEFITKTVDLLIYLTNNFKSPSALSVKIKEWIDGNLFNPLKAQDLRANFYLSDSQIARRFESSYGITPIGYYQKRRFEIAIEMMKNGEKISNVSEQLNFSSVSNFSLAFKKRFGVSPKKFLEEVNIDAVRGNVGDPHFQLEEKEG